MDEEFDSGLDVSETMSDFSDDSSFDVSSVMDEADDFSDLGELSDMDSMDDGSFDVSAIMDEADLPDETEILEDLSEEPEIIEDIPEEPEIVEDIPEEPEIVEDIPEEPETVEDIPEEPEIIEDIPEEPEIVEDIPEEPEIIEDIPEEPEIIEEIPEEPEIIEEIPEEPEIVEEIPEEPEIVEDIPEEPENIEEIPEEPEIVEDIPEEPEIVEDILGEESAEGVAEALESSADTAENLGTTTDAANVDSDTGIHPQAEFYGELPAETEEEFADMLGDELPEAPADMMMPDSESELSGSPEEESGISDFAAAQIVSDEESDVAVGPGPAQTALGEYLAEHNYGRDDYAEYSQDPEWQRLNNEFLVETGREPIDYPDTPAGETPEYGPGPAQTALGEYLAEHNYGRDDYAEYSQDPEWQRLNNEFLVETGRDPIDYPSVDIQSPLEGTGSVVDDVTEWKPAPERVYDEFEESIRLDQGDFYDTGTFYTQGINEYGYSGTCGETSMASTMNLVLGTNEFTENKVLDVAVQEGLCDLSSFSDSGGTTTDQFMELYDKMNDVCGGKLDVECHECEDVLSMEEAAKKLEEGCTLNVAVDSDTLWDETDPMGSPFPETRATDHWITVTGVQRGEDGTIKGFDIIDSGGGESYVDAEKYQAMCYGTDSLELTDPTCIVVSRKEQENQVGVVPVDSTEGHPEQHFDATDVVGPMEPNDVYESNGYIYKTDDAGRIISASGELHLAETHIRNPNAQVVAGGVDRAETDDGGHLIATRFGGSPELDNLVAENSFINRSAYKRLENAWARDLEAGNRVLVNIEPYYGTDAQRPTHITGSYTVIRPDGSSFEEYFSLTNEDLRAPEFQLDDVDGDSGFYQSLSPEDQAAYLEAMETPMPRIDEGRVFTRDPLYEDFANCPEDSDEAFELQRRIHQHTPKRKGGAI